MTMQPPIAIGTILQNRYRINRILGQGGFGRTYLAEDQGRFNELCALKEFIPNDTGAYALEKSKELFQREATILYQIQHPQVPQFRATFEQDQRLFLVQDYVAGKTYRALLEEKKGVGQTFAEAEVLQLMRSLLPILVHIHSRGIIHRDISPDNIILREADSLPVLIDFGVVKEIATRIQSPDTALPPTTVGKFGYAPSEQMQTGRAYPSSDLYALAVTALVLLTGKEPQDLYDDRTLTWNWQRWVTVSPTFAQVINRMLSHQPGDRFPSATDVITALQSPGSAPPPTQIPGNAASPRINVSNVETLAVGRRPDPTPSQPAPQQPTRNAPSIPEPQTRSLLDNPWAIGAIGTGVVLFAGFGSWALVSQLRGNQAPEPPQAFESPLVTPSPTATPTPTPTDTPTSEPTPTPTEPSQFSQRLSLVTGQPSTVEGSLRANDIIRYTFDGQEGQLITASLADEGVLLSIVGPNDRAIDRGAARVTRYSGKLPFTGRHAIILRTVKGIPESNYRLSVTLENPPTEPTPTPTETSTPTPEFDVQSITPSPDGVPRDLAGRTTTQRVKRYLVSIPPGSQLAVAVTQGAVTFDVSDPRGVRFEDGTKAVSWTGQRLPGGNYQIDVVPTQPGEPTDFTLNLTLSK